MKEFSKKTRERDIEKLKEEVFDIAVIGGGITGASIARDGALRGYKVLLLEKNDFAVGTSSKSSKLIHGGFRYLKNLEFSLVYEACSERRVLKKIAPLLVKPVPFILPVYDSKLKYYVLSLGMWLYDLLSLFKNVKRHKMLSPKEILSLEPELKRENLVGGALYYDCMVDDARFTLATLKSAYKNSAYVLNYCEVIGFFLKNKRIERAEVFDKISKKTFEVKAKVFVNATGVWSDKLREIAFEKEKRLRPTKGIHLFVPRNKIGNNNALAFLDFLGERFLFVIPWGKFSIIGTTDTDFEGDLDLVFATSKDVDYLIKSVNRIFPKVNLGYKDIVSTYASLRPLIKNERVKETKISREHEIFENSLITIAGGKFTTSRLMAKELIDFVEKKLGKKNKCLTHKKPLEDFDCEKLLNPKLVERISKRFRIDGDVVTHLIEQYGRGYQRILEILKTNKSLRERITPSLPYIKAEIPYTIKHEMTLTLSDFMIRRTHIFYEDWKQGLGCSREVAKIMAEYLTWDEREIEKQIKEYEREVNLARTYKNL